MDTIEELQKKLQESEINADAKGVTANRGRLINKIKIEINKIRENGVTLEEEKALSKMEAMLTENIADHKDQLSARYHEEFVKKSGSILSTVTALPKGVAIAVQKVRACIDDLKEAKTNKERIFRAVELLKSSGLLVATPIIFTGRFLIKHWYLVLLFIIYIFNIPGILLETFVDNTKGKASAKWENFKNGIGNFFGGNNPTVESEGYFQTLKRKLTDPEQLKKIGEDARNRINNLGTTVKDGFNLIKKGFGLINEFIKNKFGDNLEGLSQGVKDKLNGLRNKINQFQPNDPQAVSALKEINQDMYDVTKMLAEQPVPAKVA